MDDITIGVTEFVNNISVSAQPNDQIIDITVTETVETVLLDVSTTVEEVTVTATQNVIVENITVDYVNNENNIDINVTDATQDVTLNVTPTLVEINILRSGGEVNILQFNTLADFPTTGSTDYFYLAKDTNKLYRWTGSAYAEISATANARWGQIIGTLSEQTDLQNALNLKAPINSPTFTGTVSGITKGMVGLGAVDNTSDLDKPISTATQTALNAKQPLDADLTSIAALSGTFGLLKKTANNSYTIDTNTYLTGITSSDVTTALGYTPENVANKGVNNGYASLGGDGKVPSSQLPSYVDDVIEVSSFSTLPATGETGKIYITLDTNKIYRWSGSVYVEVSSSAAVWGGITGTLSNQTDLQNALNAKQDDLNGTGFVKSDAGTISYDNTTYYPASNPNGYTANTGTVTSVALTVPSAFSVSGSPITNSGTLAVTATGNTTQYIAGDGSLVTFPTMSTAGTLIREVRNTTGATLTKGTVVYISGATGNKPTVSKALATGDSTSAQTFGLVQANIANNANGNVVCVGDLTGLDTSAFTEGAQLYLSSSTAGTYTTTKQLAPNHLVYIGIITRAHPTQGQIEVNIQNGYELYELHDVSITSEANNQGLFYEASTDLWKNKSIATVLGYTPANGADYMALSGDQTISGLKTFSGFGLFEQNLFIKQGTDTAFLSGYNVIDADSTGMIFGLPNTYHAHLNLSNLTTQRDYILPNASGTIALTSDIPSLAGYVATTGNQTIAGDKTFTGAVINDGDLYIKQDSTYTSKTGYVSLFAGGGNTLSYNFGNSNINQTFTFPSTGRNYTFPDAPGTIALTSDLHSAVTIGTANGLSLSTQVLSLALASTSTTGALSSTDWNTFNNKASTASLANYLPLAGGTLTGTLNGTTAIFSGGLSGSSYVTLSTSTNTGTGLYNMFNTSSVIRWAIGNVDTETGSNAGNNFAIYRYADNGSLLGSSPALQITRSNGLVTINQALTIGGTLNGTSATFSGTLSTTAGNAILSGGGSLAITPSATRGVVAIGGSTDQFLTLASNGYILGSAGLCRFLSTPDLDFVVGGIQRIYIKSSDGNVGIGVTNPGFPLQVTKTGTDSGIYGYNVAQFGDATTNAQGLRIATSTVTSGLTNLIAATNNDASQFAFWTWTGATWGERMRISSTGNLGIGTTAPAYKLDVRGTYEATGMITVRSTNTATINVGGVLGFGGFHNGSSNESQWAWIKGAKENSNTNDNASYLGFATQTSGGSPSERLRINSVGITRALRFQVGAAGIAAGNYCEVGNDDNVGYIDTIRAVNSGDFHFRFDGTSRATINRSTGVYVATSDINKKKDIELSKIGLSEIMQLKPSLYRMKEDESDGQKELGFIAQEVKLVIPNAYQESGDFIGLNYNPIVAALTKAVQELKAELDTLKNK
jgi:hypothetical protein